MRMSASVTDLTLPQASEAEKEEYEPEAPSVGSYRSVDDVRMLRRISIAALIQSLLLVVSVGVTALLVTRPAQQVVIERTTEGDRVVAINGKPVASGYAVGYAGLMTKRSEFEAEAREKRQAGWTPQVVEVDRADPYKVKVIGTWDVTKKSDSGNGWARDMRQLIFTLHLIEDDRGRAPRNANTGFLIRDILDYTEIAAPSPASGTAATQTTQ